MLRGCGVSMAQRGGIGIGESKELRMVYVDDCLGALALALVLLFYLFCL